MGPAKPTAMISFDMSIPGYIDVSQGYTATDRAPITKPKNMVSFLPKMSWKEPPMKSKGRVKSWAQKIKSPMIVEDSYVVRLKFSSDWRRYTKDML